MVSVVAQRVRAIAARLVLDSLAVVFLVWRMLASKSRCARDAELSRCFVCHVAPLVELAAALPSRLRCISWLPCVLVKSDALVVLVEVLLGPACVASAVLLAAVFSLMVRVVWSFGLCILVKVLPRIALLCRLVGLRSGKVPPERLLALLVKSAWVLSVKVLCPWPCIWLPRMSVALLCTGFQAGLLVQALFQCVFDCASACALEAFSCRRFWLLASLSVTIEVVLLALARKGVAVVFAPMRQSRCSVFRVLLGVDVVVALLEK
ncbi:hypothetical protein Taro_027861, partial [Colocasia esculenta]|nr:hypothetical protein [Colocasia esculenta]